MESIVNGLINVVVVEYEKHVNLLDLLFILIVV